MGSRPIHGLGDGWIRSCLIHVCTSSLFEIDGEAVALAALSSLVREGRLEASVYNEAMTSFGVSTERTDITSL